MYTTAFEITSSHSQPTATPPRALTLFAGEDAGPPGLVGVTGEDLDQVARNQPQLVAIERFVRKEHAAVENLVVTLKNM
jgi:hypothetical protein